MEMKVSGDWFIRLYGPEGNLKSSIDSHNVVTTVGKEFLASFIYSAALAASTFTMKYMAVGSDSTAEAVGNTGLGTELGRHTGTVGYSSGAIYTLVATFATGSGTGSIVEYGVYSSSTGGTLLNRLTTAAVNKGASDTLTVTANLTFS